MWWWYHWFIISQKITDDAYFKSHKIALIEKEDKNKNDRTISFWEEGKGEWDSIICVVGKCNFISDEYESSFELNLTLIKLFEE